MVLNTVASNKNHSRVRKLCIRWDTKPEWYYNLGPVVQSIVSLTNSLRVISLTVLADSIYNSLIFFAEKNATYILSAKNFNIFAYHDVNFNESLTNAIVSFEQLGPGPSCSKLTMSLVNVSL